MESSRIEEERRSKMVKVPPANRMDWKTMKLHCEKRHPEVTIITYSAHDVVHRSGRKQDHEHKD